MLEFVAASGFGYNSFCIRLILIWFSVAVFFNSFFKQKKISFFLFSRRALCERVRARVFPKSKFLLL